jgi:hypothetical protein
MGWLTFGLLWRMSFCTSPVQLRTSYFRLRLHVCEIELSRYAATETHCLNMLHAKYDMRNQLSMYRSTGLLRRARNSPRRIRQVQHRIFSKILSEFNLTSHTHTHILSRDYGSVTNNNGFWIGWLDLLTPSFTITLNHNPFTTHNTSSAQFWSVLFRPEPRLTWTTTVFSSSLPSTVVSWLLSSTVTHLVQSSFTNYLVLGPPFYREWLPSNLNGRLYTLAIHGSVCWMFVYAGTFVVPNSSLRTHLNGNVLCTELTAHMSLYTYIGM